MAHKCKRCGKCCNPPRLYKEDIKRIKKLGYKEDDFIYTDNLNNNYLKNKDGWCIFLKKGKTAECKIYNFRPKICRLYPSELKNGSCIPEELAFDKYLEKKKST
ncbi:MAG: YkgJ family cysteine cluster protein [Nanoarchaeota archaeon]|nr:YkgJ family cysteine cluster protein [Nanoarchaeota archaeon]MBU1005831.1 YkgJ family cysteine cluster protein [Nanoarchaeota archaeon]MBU1947015.1 YkgJ family cysteine cluster protein [Nanoarchaeota archaeon]